MMAVISTSKICKCLFYSCRNCGVPLLTLKDGETDDRREIGICADCEFEGGFDVEAFDPYGQPIASEVMA